MKNELLLKIPLPEIHPRLDYFQDRLKSHCHHTSVLSLNTIVQAMKHISHSKLKEMKKVLLPLVLFDSFSLEQNSLSRLGGLVIHIVFPPLHLAFQI